ncbi:signal peptidase I [candidate division WWE3 bacterium RIFCSPHIGHO2_12_FULL_38_15]|uniref:Signal peptidase I n=1 Tax=candidate division WWE3 bacterium RIFCSPHIGHO2_02_FULL_38_14 TaxID=1802620 RepID=A0A1F4V8D0_UNCKA|nr:MAG: signal peptidase I [candidate division WWE3 bacterium RIFCSPHIGHO2_01_FULL_38_45]OGC48648.1 MAG: signal peptidase I [candidate division WWE3 bacterium RIFCSPHIGHO2_12_FULL_38_15]OGC53054.1 MAG: signal peptidase I [candidate division WWE3 bacterium RIFCSPLOWO2_01_FULL_37_24]OGC53417.1 MAG: signal peptidase I [candidate division WWE3 bacterium RIFCSPHIGHO2_02_FULL_38_14]HLB51891.1 signal peptidase I [Patescibacteria group bacterium]
MGKFFLKTFFFIVIPVIIINYLVSGYLKINLPLKNKIPVAGTGSMYPTFPKGNGNDDKNLGDQIAGFAYMTAYPSGIKFGFNEYLSYKMQRGDIVSFSNDKVAQITKEVYGNESGYIKRVIGLPGEEFLIKNGLVYIDNNPLVEPYTNLAHSTFGGEFITECKGIKIPEDSYIVLGDNRKGSSDSRHGIGFVKAEDIDHVVPINEQKGSLDKNWRNTSLDLSEVSKIRLDGKKFLELLNVEREKNGFSNLKYDTRLETSASKRAFNILKYNDFSSEAVKSGYTLKTAMSESGYENVLWGEVPVQGYYQAEELIENLFEFPESKKFVINGDFDDFGVASFEGEIEGCPTQIIVLHFGGYVPPEYGKDVIDSWKQLLAGLQDIRPGWIELKDYEEFYREHKKDIDRVIEIINYRTERVRRIVNKMENHQWLDDSDRRFIDEDSKLNDELSALSKKVNEVIN